MSRRLSAFTLVEILVTIGVAAVLAVVLFYLLNPSKRIGQGGDARRITDLQTIVHALELYTADHRVLPWQIAAAAIAPGQKYVLCSAPALLSCSGQSNDCLVITDTNFIGPYLAALPIDPARTAVTDTGYYVARSATNTLVVGACSAYGDSPLGVVSTINLPPR
ncbi:MAG: type II secretion system protein [Candidatus Komeilibacteria bacterium]